MALEFDKPKVGNIKMMLYGEGGLGKTSLALTSFNPLLFDFNNGVHRASIPIQPITFSEKTAKKSWEKVWRTLKSKDDIQQYETIITDSYGDVLELIKDYLYETKPKLFMSPEKPKEAGWGEIKAESVRYSKALKSFDKDLIIIAHNNYVKKNRSEEYKSYPDIIGGSKKIFERDFDLIGYITLKEGKRTLCFDHSEDAMGKNSIELPEYSIPDHHSEQFPTFMAEVIEDIKARFHKRLSDQSTPQKQYRLIKQKIDSATKPFEFDKILDQIKEVPFQHTQKMLKHALNFAAQKLGIRYNQELPGFELIDKEATQEKREAASSHKVSGTMDSLSEKVFKES